MHKLTEQDKAVLSMIKSMKSDNQFTFWRSQQLQSMIISLGVEGAKEMATNLLRKPAQFVSLEDCQIYLKTIADAKQLAATHNEAQLVLGQALNKSKSGSEEADRSFASASTMTLKPGE